MRPPRSLSSGLISTLRARTFPSLRLAAIEDAAGYARYSPAGFADTDERLSTLLSGEIAASSSKIFPRIGCAVGAGSGSSPTAGSVTE